MQDPPSGASSRQSLPRAQQVPCLQPGSDGNISDLAAPGHDEDLGVGRGNAYFAQLLDDLHDPDN
jgi:hypothetical protein